MNIEITKDFKKALEILEKSNQNLFITGKAGTGKSTLLSCFINKTEKKVAIIAPTGIAALNIEGETIHSFFKFKPQITVEDAKKIGKRFRKSELYNILDMIIIDEISMVRADLLDCIDVFLRESTLKKEPFGGIQMVFIGDLYQLPPVVTKKEKEFFKLIYESPYFFSSNVMKEKIFKLNFIELEKIFRQKDKQFIELLNSIRNKTITEEQLEILNQRALIKNFKENKGSIYLTSTNKMAEKINLEKLSKIKEKKHTFTAQISEGFDKKYSPTDLTLNLKNNSQVMFLNNNSSRYWVNGSIGFIKKIKRNSILIEIQNKGLVEVIPHKWEIFKHYFDKEKKRISKESVGYFIQFPIKLAWAITIHKSQGKTYDRVTIDLSSGVFAHGQTYVALSRCTSFEGLFLKQHIKKGHIIMDYKVVNFLTKIQYDVSEKKSSKEEKNIIINKAISLSTPLKITYLKANDQKSKRIIEPNFLGEMSYSNKKFIGIKAFCRKRKEERIFRVDRILEIENITKM